MMCEFEERILAVRAGEPMPADLAEHLASCDECRVRRLLHLDAGLLAVEAMLPSASAMLWRGELRRRRRQADRAAIPIRIAEAAAAAVVMALVVVSGSAANQHGVEGWLVFASVALMTAVVLWRRLRAGQEREYLSRHAGEQK